MAAETGASTPVVWPPLLSDDVYAAYDHWRDEFGDVAFDETSQSWIVTGYTAARHVLTGRTWSSDPLSSEVVRNLLTAQGIDELPLSGSMLTADRPDHSRLRGSVRDVFTPTYINQMADGIDAIAHAVIDSIPSGVTFDAVRTIATPLPVTVIAEWLALDTHATQVLCAEAPHLVKLLDGVLGTELSSDVVGPVASLLAEFLPMAADRRTHPGDDLFSLLATDPALSLDEVVANAVLLAIAGHETTAGLLGASLARLLTGDVGARLVDGFEAITPEIVGELLRLDGPAQAVGRTSMTTQDLMGRRIERGQRVVVVVGAANRDPAAYPDPHQFRADRSGPPSLALGFGPHRCLGGALSKLETEIALNGILARDPILIDERVESRDTSLLRAPAAVMIEFQR